MRIIWFKHSYIFFKWASATCWCSLPWHTTSIYFLPLSSELVSGIYSLAGVEQRLSITMSIAIEEEPRERENRKWKWVLFFDVVKFCSFLVGLVTDLIKRERSVFFPLDVYPRTHVLVDVPPFVFLLHSHSKRNKLPNFIWLSNWRVFPPTREMSQANPCLSIKHRLYIFSLVVLNRWSRS